MQVFNVQSKNWRIASLVYHTRSETKINNGKKIKQTDERNKSEKQYKSVKGSPELGTSSLYGGRDLWKR